MSDMKRLKQLAGLRTAEFLNEAKSMVGRSLGSLGDREQAKDPMSWKEVEEMVGKKTWRDITSLLDQANDILDRRARQQQSGRSGSEVSKLTKQADALTRKAEKIAKKEFGYVPYIARNPMKPRHGQYQFIVDRSKVKK